MKQTYIILPGNSRRMECIWSFDNTIDRRPVPTHMRQSTVRNPITFQNPFIPPGMLLLPTLMFLNYTGAPRYSGPLFHIKHSFLSIKAPSVCPAPKVRDIPCRHTGVA